MKHMKHRSAILDLSDELLLNIFKFLEKRTRLECILILDGQAVSTANPDRASRLLNDLSLDRELDLTSYSSLLPRKAIDIQNLKSQFLTKINVSGLGRKSSLTTLDLIELLHTCRHNLRDLDISNSTNLLRKSLLIYMSCNLPHLISFKANMYFGSGIGNVLQSTPEELEDPNHIKNLNLIDGDSVLSLINCRNLKNLDFSWCRGSIMPSGQLYGAVYLSDVLRLAHKSQSLEIIKASYLRPGSCSFERKSGAESGWIKVPGISASILYPTSSIDQA